MTSSKKSFRAIVSQIMLIIKDRSKALGLFLILSTLIIYTIHPSSRMGKGIIFLTLILGIYFYLAPLQNTSRHKQKPNLKTIFGNLGNLLIMGLIVFISQFWYFREFGLYEKDFSSIAPILDLDTQGVLSTISYLLFSQFDQYTLSTIGTTLFSHIGFSLGGLPGIYLLAMIIPTCISFLFFLTIKNLTKNILAAYLGAFLFIVFPPINTPQSLTVIFEWQLPFLLLLLSLDQYLRGNQINFRIFAILTLIFRLEYTPLLLFFPLLTLKHIDKLFWKQWLKHILEFFFLSFTIQFAISLSSDFRTITELLKDLTGIPGQIIRVFSDKVYNWFLYNFSSSPITIFSNTSTDILIITAFIASAFTVIALISSSKFIEDQKKTSNTTFKNPLFSISISTSETVMRLIKLFLSTLLILFFAFSGVSKYQPLTIITGRHSSIYILSALPFILCFICFFMIIYLQIDHQLLKKFTLLILIGFLGLLAADRVITQKKMIASWKIEQWVWTNLIDEVEEITEESIILIDVTQNQTINELQTNFSPTLQTDLFPLIYRYKPNWRRTYPTSIVYSRVNQAYIAAFINNNERVQRTFQITSDGELVTPTTTITGSDLSMSLLELEKTYLYKLIYNESYKDITLPKVINQYDW